MVNAKRGKNEELKKLQNKSKHDSKQSTSEKIKLFLIPCTVLGALIISWHHNHSLGSMVNTPLNEPRIIDESSYTSPENLDRFWGSYRYFVSIFFELRNQAININFMNIRDDSKPIKDIEFVESLV